MTQQKMQVTADNESRKPNYSNLALITHRKEEFVIDFLFVDPQAQAQPQGQQGTKAGQAMLSSRVVLNPVHMKRLFQAIGEKIQRYEKNFGNIVIPPKLQ